MKRLIGTLLAAIVVLPLAPAGAQSVIGDVAGYQIAISVWFERDGKGTTVYGALAFRGSFHELESPPSVSPQGVLGLGGVGKGDCHTRHGVQICHVTIKSHQLDPTSFEFDPLLESATMTIPSEKHKIVWTGRGSEPRSEYGTTGGANWVNGYLMLSRKAFIEGRAFGDRFTPKAPGFSFLFEGADAFAFMKDRLKASLDDEGNIMLTVRFPKR